MPRHHLKAEAMQRDARHASIVNLVRQRGFMSIDTLAQHFNVTPQTIRRDINELSDQDLVSRYHGGKMSLGDQEAARL